MPLGSLREVLPTDTSVEHTSRGLALMLAADLASFAAAAPVAQRVYVGVVGADPQLQRGLPVSLTVEQVQGQLRAMRQRFRTSGSLDPEPGFVCCAMARDGTSVKIPFALREGWPLYFCLVVDVVQDMRPEFATSRCTSVGSAHDLLQTALTEVQTLASRTGDRGTAASLAELKVTHRKPVLLSPPRKAVPPGAGTPPPSSSSST